LIGLDTNVVVRFLVQDHPAQSKRANAIFAKFTPEKPGHIALVTLAELVWVLRSCYAMKRRDIADMLDAMHLSRDIVFEQTDLLRGIIQAYRKGTADFSDYTIATINHHYGCSKTVTFNIVAAKSGAMELA
jgi:predicted nucleic-acid-binding protein